jgi:hypothetical protein
MRATSRGGAARLDRSFHINGPGVQLQGPHTNLAGGTTAARRTHAT